MIKSPGISAVFDRDFCDGQKCSDFIHQLDTLMDKGVILKNGNTSFVSRLNWNGTNVVVKRYNHKGLFHSLRQSLKTGRAKMGWLHGHRLKMFSILTPDPLAYIQVRKFGLIWKAYLVTRYMQGKLFYNIINDEKIEADYRDKTENQVIELLGKLRNANIVHGDMKHSNILITDSGPAVTDLDAMKAYRYKWQGCWKKHKDIKRFRQSYL
jgi:tRNA A-37 threonylcarbamoyl transferase component Bud32